jgi:hypothetical protein
LQPKSSWVDAAAPATGLFAVGSRVFLFNSVEITEINYPPTFTTNCQLPNHLRPFCEAAAGQVSGKQTNLVFFYRSTWWPCVKKDIVCALFYSCQFSPLGTLQRWGTGNTDGMFFARFCLVGLPPTDIFPRGFFEQGKGSVFVKYYMLAALSS